MATTWRSVLGATYPIPLSCSMMRGVTSVLRMSSSSGKQHLSNALSHNECSQLSEFFEASSRHHGDNDAIISLQVNDIIQSSALDALQSAYQAVVQTFKGGWKNQNVSPILWRTHFYQTNSSTVSLSNKWHYDLEINDHIFFAMIFLNHANNFGISIYDNQSSCAISSVHGYVGAPANMRASNLHYYSTQPTYKEPTFYEAQAGDVIIFQPSRCLHKGIIPKALEKSFQSRKVLHLSFMITPQDSLPKNFTGCNVESSIINFTQSSALPPFFTNKIF